MSPAVIVGRKVRSLLNKLTMENFDSISDQIVTWVNLSEKEKDARTLFRVVKLIFEKAINEADWNEICARLCRKIMEMISPKVQDEHIWNSEGKPFTGGQLFRIHLLIRCQEDFEHRWVAKETTACAAAAKASDGEAVKATNERKGNKSEPCADECYAAQKAKRQCLGLTKFICELFRRQMLTERIVHECVKKLLGNVEVPEEQEIKSLCQLLKTVGQLLDVPKARACMDLYFQGMRNLCESPNVCPRMRFMLLDVIELRDQKWQPRNVVNALTMLAAVDEATAKQKSAQETQAFQRQLSTSRDGSEQGAEHNAEQVSDGWAVTGAPGGSQPRPSGEAHELLHFGEISKGAQRVVGPSDVFAGRKDNRHESQTRTNSPSAKFSRLSQNPELVVEPKPSQTSNWRRSTPGDKPKPVPQRKKLQLLPRVILAPGETLVATSDVEAEGMSGAQMSERMPRRL
ncbi:armadillo-type protein [Pisolithus croceorrhizus]|nr:armadillo-type protein [Pisolithus croceorrhizus]